MTTQPLFAEILVSTDEATHAVAWVFSKPMLREFTGEEHQKRAREWVCNWQKHFDHEWYFIKDAFSKIMGEFSVALSLHGVNEEAIKKACETVLKTSDLYAQGIL